MYIFSQGCELRIAEKLHEGLLELSSKGRMRVLPAAQLLSHTTASAITYLFERGALKNQSAPTAAEMIETVNNWFDVLNSRDVGSANILKSPFGKNLTEQTQAILKMTDMITNIRVGTHTSLIPFQQGIILTNQSVLELHR